ncbi:MAG TPA: class I SAM-dependent methyltransferase [Anaerolineales bacterium]|nr:class I SAM-dependent methyltransferase [Anaerolineales bacterium]
MDDFLEANRELWDHWTGEHEASPFYDLAGFKKGKDRLRSIELSELGDVAGKSLLHLQCHFGMDTLAWSRRGAIVTGADLSPRSIALARSLNEELRLPATFICADVYDLPDRLTAEFDFVFTSYGVLHWLSDLPKWAGIVARFLKPGGVFYIVDDHPFFRALSTNESRELLVRNPYFYSKTPDRVEMSGSYATEAAGEKRTFFIWNHPLGEVIGSILEAGLTIEHLHEFPFAARAKYPFMEQGDDGWWRLPESYLPIPFLFSLRAHKPGPPSS